MSALETEIKKLIIETLNLEDVTVDDIDANEPLFGDGLGLDSIDALELGVALKKNYNLQLNSEDEKTKANFESVRSLAHFVESQQG